MTAALVSEAKMRIIHAWLRECSGDDLMEYALLAGLVGIAGAGALFGFDDIINSVYTSWDAATQSLWEPEDPQ